MDDQPTQQRYRFDFGVVAEDGEGETLFAFDVLCSSDAEAQALWAKLLDVLPTGRVGGGVRRADDDTED